MLIAAPSQEPGGRPGRDRRRGGCAGRRHGDVGGPGCASRLGALDADVVLVREDLSPTPVWPLIREAVTAKPYLAIVVAARSGSAEVLAQAMDAGARAVVEPAAAGRGRRHEDHVGRRLGADHAARHRRRARGDHERRGPDGRAGRGEGRRRHHHARRAPGAAQRAGRPDPPRVPGRPRRREGRRAALPRRAAPAQHPRPRAGGAGPRAAGDRRRALPAPVRAERAAGAGRGRVRRAADRRPGGRDPHRAAAAARRGDRRRRRRRQRGVRGRGRAWPTRSTS
nr:hypothetical protein [Angustibacter aerolatus]